MSFQNTALRCFGVMLLAAGGGIAASVAVPAAAGASTADGHVCSIVGTPHNDVLYGTPGNDVICGLGGNDTLYGRGGKDVLIGGPGDDTLIGGAGDDTMRGDAGSDTASYRDHSSRIVASLNTSVEVDDTIRETDHIGADVENLTGGSAADTLSGNRSNNVLDGGAGGDHLEGGPGNDTENGGTGNDHLQGGPGNDHLNGESGNDTISGDDGNDSLSGGSGDDVELGGNGDDDIRDGDHSGTIDGGDGSDTVECSSRAAAGTIVGHVHGADDCQAENQDLQSYVGTVSSVDTINNTMSVQWRGLNHAAQTWVAEHGNPNPVALTLTTATRVATEHGVVLQAGDGVEVEATTTADLLSLVAVVIQAEH